MNKAKVAVLGGCGFLGTYLVNELLQRNYQVKVYDKKYSEFIPSGIYTALDILDKESLDNIFKNESFDFVYNLAGFANLDKAVHYPLETITLNVIGNLNILEALRNTQIKRFIYASSAYAMSEKGSFYGISKLTSEKIIEEYEKRFKLKFTILRFGSLYSERPFDNNYIFNLIENALKNKKIVHSGDGEEIREYIHASDAARLAADVIEDEKYTGKHLILTGAERMKRVELFNMINEMLGNQLTIELLNKESPNHYRFTPYSFRAEDCQRLTPNPYTDMGQGILNCIREAYRFLQQNE